MSQASLAILIPTRDSAAFLPDHLNGMKEWVDLADDIVCVDSESKDGTVELLRRELPPQKTRFFTHPPGLYQSWNFGLQQVTAKYVYISTVGDSMERQGLTHLREVAEQFQSDVVLSKQHFMDAAGGPAKDQWWPVDDILGRRRLAEPALLERGEQLVYAATNLWGALLGSSASNLYRAACLRERPFPTNYGTAGDGGWAIENIFDVKIAVTPRRFSTFRHHEKSYSLAPYRVDSLALKYFRALQATIRARSVADPTVPPLLERWRWPELEAWIDRAAAAQNQLEELRRTGAPWYLRPEGWKARRERTRCQARILAIKDEILGRGSS